MRKGLSALINGLLGLELVLFDSFELHALLRIERFSFDVAQELLQVLVHKEAVHPDIWLLILLVLRIKRVFIVFGLQSRQTCHLGPTNQVSFVILRKLGHLGNHDTLWEAAHNRPETLFLTMHLEKLLKDELGRGYNIDADHDRHTESQNAEQNQVANWYLLGLDKHVQTDWQTDQ